MKVLLTGGSGFIGRACTDALRARGVHVVAPLSHELDVLNEEATRAFLAVTRPTHLLHAAWRPVHGDIMTSTENFLWAKASLSLLHAFRDCGGARVAFVGSSAEYDWSGGLCRTGQTPLRPDSVYGAAKHALHLAAQSYAASHGLSFAWPRVFFVYGPGEHESKLSVYVLKNLLRGQIVELSHGRQLRDYLYIRDVAEGVVTTLLSSLEGEVDIASGKAYSVGHMAREIARQIKRPDLLRFGARPPRAHDVPLVLSEIDHARRHLAWQPRVTLQDGVAEMVAWGRAAYTRPDSPMPWHYRVPTATVLLAQCIGF